MEHIPLIPKIQKPSTDISHVIREVFQKNLEQEVLDKYRLENLERNYGIEEAAGDESVLYAEIYKEHTALMDKIASIEEQLAYSQERALLEDDLVQKNEILRERMKLKTVPLIEEYHGEMEKYLIRSIDLLPPIHEQLLDFRLKAKPSKIIQEKESSQIIKMIRKSKSSLPPISLVSSINQAPTLKKKQNKQIQRIRLSLKRKKLLLNQVIFQAEPDCVVFTNYLIGVKYEKHFKLKNVSNTVGRFDLVPLPINSKFRIEWDLLPGKEKMVASGLSVWVKVLFCTDSLEDEKELLLIPVLGGKIVSVTLLAYREAPQLRVIELLDTEETLLPEKQKVLCTTIECGQCLIGAIVNTTIRLYNQGGEARFWLISEEDWCFSNVRNVSNNNAIELPPFMISPCYFTVSKGGVIDINIKFYPEIYGLQVEKLYIVCDNCTYRELELIGDGFLYEDYFLTIENTSKTFQIDIEDDIGAEHYLDLGKCTTTGKVKGAFSTTNNSPLELQYFWNSRKPNINCPTPPQFKTLDEGNIYISPQMGHFRAFEPETFSVFCNTNRTEVGNYRHIFQLYITNIPRKCLSESSHPLKMESKLGVIGYVDILVKEIEVWVQVVPLFVKIEPCVLQIRGIKMLTDEPQILRTINITNKSDSPVTFVWESVPNFGSPVTAMCCVMSMEPSVVRVYPRSCIASKLSITVVTPGRQVEKYQCIVNEGELTLELSVEIQVDDPVISPSTHLLDFGLVKHGTFAELPLAICNKSSSAVVWKVEEFVYHPKWKFFQILDRCNLSSNMGYLCHEGSICGDVFYYLNTRKNELWGSLLGVATMSAERAMPNYFQEFVLVIADIILPHIKIESPPQFNAILAPYGMLYVGKEIECPITMKNLTHVPTTFAWGMPFGKDLTKLKVKFCPEKGTVPNAQKMNIFVNITPMELGIVDDFYVICRIGRIQRPIVLAIKAEVGGRKVTFHIPSDISETEGICAYHRSWTVDDHFIFPKEIISDNDVGSGEVILEETDEASMLTMGSMICSDVGVEPEFSITECEGKTDNFERKKNVRKRSTDEMKPLQTSDNLFFVTTESQYFDENVSTSTEPQDQAHEETDIEHLNEFYTDTSSTQVLDNFEDFPEIDFIPQFPLSMPSRCSSDGDHDLNESDIKILSSSALLEEEQREMHSSTLITISETNSASDSDLANINQSDRISKEGSQKPSLQSLQKSNSSLFHEQQSGSKISKHFDKETVVESVHEEKITEEITSSSSEPGASENGTSLACVHEFSYTYIPVIHFYNVPCHQPIKKTLIIQNETPICTSFTVNISKFHEQENIVMPSMNEQVQMKIAGKKLDTWKYRIREMAGIVIKAEPMSSELGPYEVLPIDIWVYADTWGIYTDQLVCHISGLSPFYIEIEVQVVGFPLSFPMCYGNIQNKAILRFGTLPYCGKPQIRKVKIRNESSVRIFVNWHVFLINDNMESQQPFNIVLDIFNRQNSSSKKDLTSKSNILVTSPQDMKVNISPYHGVEDFSIFLVRPGDICIPPKGESHFFIRANPIISKPNIDDSLHIKAVALAYIRISDYDSKKEGFYERASGADMDPVTLHLEMTIQIPKFTMHYTLGDLTFKVNATDIVCAGYDSFSVSKRLMFTNKNEASLTATIEASKPFEILRINTPDVRIKHKPSKESVTLNSGQSAEVHVECMFTKKHVDKAYEVLKNSSSPLSDMTFVVEKVVKFKGELFLRQEHVLVQTVPLYAQITFPCVVIDTEALDFGPVFITKTKQLWFTIENKSTFWVNVNIAKAFNVAEFTIVPMDVSLPPAPASGSLQTEIHVSFQPIDTKEYMDRLEITTCIPGDYLDVSLSGVGTVDSKFNIEI